jgi:cytochrome c oxidase subunit 1
MNGNAAARAIMWAFISTGLAVFGLMVLVGLALRAEQAAWIAYDPGTFYALMTLHGSGMIVAMALCGMGGLWYIMYQERQMDARLAWSGYGAIVLGVLCVILSIFPGRFAAGWTFLYPLPFVGTTWPNWATGCYLIGVALVMVGWTIYCVQLLGCVLAKYGGLRGAMGWDLVLHHDRFAASGKPEPPPQAFAALVVSIDGLFAVAGGMLVGVALLVHWIDPSVAVDPLWAKNLTYEFGHTFANLTIYMAIAFVYVALPRYAGREWHTTQVLALAWWGTLLFVATAYFHHLYMDFVQPRGLQYLGEVASYLAAFPPAVVTIFGGALLVYRSKMRWTMGSVFLYAGLVGWLVGGVGALIDATVPVNFSLHNTLWVPAHFHTYLLEGVLLFVLGWVFSNLESRSGSSSSLVTRWAIGGGIFGGGALLLLGWYVAGAASVPRRYAVQPVPGPEIASWAAIGAIILIAGLLVCLFEALRLARARKGEVQA